MPGRPIPSEADMILRGYGARDMARRRAVLRETLSRLSAAAPPGRYHDLAAANLARWREHSAAQGPEGAVEVHSGDWGDVALALTRTHGACFAVLNMANAYVPGGGYVEGMAAQEENMYRRTDCHFRIGSDAYDPTEDRYQPAMTALLSARDGRVYLDAERPRVCLRGSEDRTRDDLGYAWLPDDLVFPFYELRAAAQDLRGGARFDRDEARRRIAAQLDTLHGAGVRHAVLGAFGCGAFRNPASDVARLYREELDARRRNFAVIAFAVFAPGYGPDNFTPFADALG